MVSMKWPSSSQLAVHGGTGAFAQVTITQGPEQIAVDINGKPFTVFYVAARI